MAQLSVSPQADTLNAAVFDLARILDKLDHMISSTSNAGLHSHAVVLSGLAHDLEHERRAMRRKAHQLRAEAELAEVTELLRPAGVVIPIRER